MTSNGVKKHIITINGFPGSGKSSAAKGVAKKLGYEHFSSGDLYRKMAADRGLTVEELNYAAEKQKEIDFEVDKLITSLGSEKNNLVMDSRMGFHFIPDSFKVFLDLDPKTAAERTFAHIRNQGRESQSGASAQEVLEKTLKRRASEQKRYQSLYGVDINDTSQFDLVVDTARHNLDQVIEIVVDGYQKWLTTT